MRGTAMGRKATEAEEAVRRNDGDGREMRRIKFGACGLELGIVTRYILVGRVFTTFSLLYRVCTAILYRKSKSRRRSMDCREWYVQMGLAWKVME